MRQFRPSSTGVFVELEDAKNTMMQKIGRNILVYQQIEQLLKILVVEGNTSV